LSVTARTAALVLVAVLAGCGGARGSTALPAGSAALSGATAKLVITIPAAASVSATKRGVRYVPATTHQMVVVASDANGNAEPAQAFDLSTDSTLCTSALNGARTCTAQVVAPISTADRFVVTLNALQGDPAAEVAVATGTVTGAVAEGQANTLPPLVLGGIVAGGSIFPQTRGYTYGATSVPLVVTARDASYNKIIGAYDPSGAQVTVSPLDPNGTLTVNNGSGDTTISAGQGTAVTSSGSTITLHPPATSTGEVVEVQFSGNNASSGLTFVQPNAMPTDPPRTITSGNGPPAGTPLVLDAQGESLTWISQNSIWRYSEQGPSPTASLICGSFTIGGQTTALYPDSAVDGLDFSGQPTTYFLASDILYQVLSSNGGVCSVEDIDGTGSPSAGHRRNLRYVLSSGRLVMNSDEYPVLSATFTQSGQPPTWDTYSNPLASAASHPDGLVAYQDADTVAFSDSASGYVGVFDLTSNTLAEVPVSGSVVGLSIDANGDIGYIAGGEADVWHPSISGAIGTYFAPYDLGTVCLGVGTTLATVGNADNAFELWAIDANGVLTSYAVPYSTGSAAQFAAGAVSSTPLAAAGSPPTAIGTILASTDSAATGQLVLGASSAIVTYPSVGLMSTSARHRAPRTVRRR